LNEAEKSPDLDSDPLTWWNVRTLLYPFMCKLVEKYFAFVATSVPSECLFSASGNVIAKKQIRLTPENVDKLIILHENSKTLLALKHAHDYTNSIMCIRL